MLLVLIMKIIIIKYQGSQVAADGGYERDVVHRMNEGVQRMGSAGKCAEQ